MFQVLRDRAVSVDGCCSGMPGCGIAEEVAGVGDGEVEGRVLRADCFGDDFVGVYAGSGGVVVEFTVGSIASFGGRAEREVVGTETHC